MPVSQKTKLASGPANSIEIKLDRLASNLNILKKSQPHAAVLAVIKANAYGHGLAAVAKALENQVSFFGISSASEVREIKEHGIKTPLLLFGHVFEEELLAVLSENVRLCLSSVDEAKEISPAAKSLKLTASVHIKIDTGMGRMGMRLEGAEKKIEEISKLPNLYLEGIFTHFPTAEREDGFMETQAREFGLFVEMLEKKGLHFKYRHAANSAASLRLRSPIFNLIRPGLMLYGLYPDASLKNIAEVRPVLSLSSRIALVKKIQAGDSVGYGRTFVAQSPTRIGVLPLGYSHGYPFQASGKSQVIYQGKRYPLAGRVSMDYMCVDFQDAAPAVGDEVTLMGEEGGESITAEEIASWCGTIPYEIVTRMSTRLIRVYSP